MRNRVKPYDTQIMTRLPMFILMSWPIYRSLLSKPTLFIFVKILSVVQSPEVSIVRTKDALSSLFKYLTQETENDEGEPYFYRNVMVKGQNQET